MTAAFLGDLDELADEIFAAGIALVDTVGPDPFRLDRVDHVDALVVVDEHVLLAGVAHRTDRTLGFGLRLLAGHFAAGGAPLEVGGERRCGLDHVTDVGLLLFEQQVLALADHEGADRHEGGEGQDDEKQDAREHAVERAKHRHCPVVGFPQATCGRFRKNPLTLGNPAAPLAKADSRA